MVKVSGRAGAEGGADINLVERFEQARRQAVATQTLAAAFPAPDTRPVRAPLKRVDLV